MSVDDIWLKGDGTRTATVAATHTTKVVEEKLVSTTKYAKLTISGKVTVDGITGQQAPVEIQYQTDRGYWETRHSLMVPYNKTFTVTVGAAYADRWRVHTPGTKNIGPSTGTRVIRQPRTRTEFTTVRIAPRPVAKGQQLTVSGVLRTYDTAKGYAVYPGQKVRYCFQPDGSTVTQEVGTSVSLADGGFSKKFTAQTSGYWWIRFVDADAAHLATGYHPLGRVQVTG
ncbi:hypothetical protein M8Z33_23645 [Streptomyces sp. ZAF1911]|uniref:hypothetical protein n=1 Tax=Streptomyces sp. ZAF1911 TaxID=2944129 RepID=UPI00237A5DE2|nr:hypothetical protein [Streptomyces sp. ZAF1911]MDD9379594.1 hypothetical protein [Streptomyces sp. ZAF1911]